MIRNLGALRPTQVLTPNRETQAARPHETGTPSAQPQGDGFQASPELSEEQAVHATQGLAEEQAVSGVQETGTDQDVPATSELSMAALAAHGQQPSMPALRADQQVSEVGAIERGQSASERREIHDDSSRRQRTNTRNESIKRQVGQAPTRTNRPSGAANVQAPAQLRNANRLNVVKQTGTSQANLSDRRPARTPDRASYLQNLKATFAV